MSESEQPLPRVTTHPDGRFLMTETGEPFFWMGDTDWELFHRLTREGAERLLDNRAAYGFNVLQIVALAEEDGLHTPNCYGQTPLIEDDPTRPNEAYFQFMDEVIQMAADRGLYVALLPTWGDKLTHMWGVGPRIFNEENAFVYGKFLGERYRDQSNVIWVIGGDRPVVYTDSEGIMRNDLPIWTALANGVRAGMGDLPLLMTYHPMGGRSTSEWIHNEPWLDMNMMQSGHGGGHDVPVWEMIEKDYAREPAKPTLDGEPNYEDHPVNPWPKWDPANGYYDDYDVRKQSYRSVFAGGCGVTYGNHSVWQSYEEGRSPVNFPRFDWQTAIERPGAQQVRHLRALMESRSYFTRIPDQSLLLSPVREGGAHVRATRDALGRYAMVYLPLPQAVRVDLSLLSGAKVEAQWYDPRTGTYQAIEVFEREGERTFTPPADGPDWVLVLDALDEAWFGE